MDEESILRLLIFSVNTQIFGVMTPHPSRLRRATFPRWGRLWVIRNIGKTVRVILSGVHGTGTKPNREAATSEAKSGSRTNHI